MIDPLLVTLPNVDELIDTFSETITYSEIGIPGSPVVVTSVVPSFIDPGVTITFLDNTVTISGKYTSVFIKKFYTYIPKDQPNVLIPQVPVTLVPAEIDSLITFTPDTDVLKVVNYVVNTNKGVGTIVQTVTNNWNNGREQMQQILARGRY